MDIEKIVRRSNECISMNELSAMFQMSRSVMVGTLSKSFKLMEVKANLARNRRTATGLRERKIKTPTTKEECIDLSDYKPVRKVERINDIKICPFWIP